MPSSDEDFESADEGHNNVEKTERKKRLSSSNYSDSTLESDKEFKTPLKTANIPLAVKETTTPKALDKKEADGWDDFDIDESDPIEVQELPSKPVKEQLKTSKTEQISKTSQDTGWDDFGDWGEDDGFNNTTKEQTPEVTQSSTSPGGTPASAPTQAPASTGWGWGWSVDSLLTTATAGISNITTQVSQGISTVLETGIGAPDPEELAKASIDNQVKRGAEVEDNERNKVEPQGSAVDVFQFGSLLSGVTKFVENTGTKVLTGGLDTLETIGKKTMEVLQDGDPGLAKKRAMLGLDSGDKPILSQVLREAKARADEEDSLREVKREAKEIHYETLFDDFEGLVHLEALEMLSKQTALRIEERIRTADPEKRQDIKETLQQVAELCEMPEDDDDDQDVASEGDKADVFHEKLQSATQDLGLKLQFQSLIKQYTEILEWIVNASDVTDKAVYKRGVSALAHTTALSVHTYHKTAELLLTKQRRSTADEADALTQMTVVLTKHISELATLFTEKLNSMQSENKDEINNYITNIFLEAGNSSTYIQNAFHLALPILQIGAV